MGFKSFMGKALLRLTGWKLVIVEPPPGHGCILIGAPHTSYWDGVMMIFVAWGANLEMKWLGKEAIFRSPVGPLARAVGGIPIDRSNAGGIVESLVEELNERQAEELVTGKPERPWALAIAPEGTRSPVSHWKSGFYRIAAGTGLPIVLGFIDKSTRTCGLGPTLTLQGDPKADMDVLRAFYEGKTGVRRHQVTNPRLRMEEDQ